MTSLDIVYLPTSRDPPLRAGFAYLCLAYDGTVWLTSRPVPGLTLEAVRHGRFLEWPIGRAEDLSNDARRALLEDPHVLDLLEQIHAGHALDQGAEKPTGSLTPQAQQASDALAAYLRDHHTARSRGA